MKELILLYAAGLMFPIIFVVYRWADQLREQNAEKHRLYMEYVHEWFAVVRRNAAIDQIVDRAHAPRFRKQQYAHTHANHMPGFVYLLRMNNDYCKIGFATDVEHRLMRLRNVTPYQLDLVHVIATDHMARLEQTLHQRYDSVRTHGEWFRLAPEDVTAICSIASPITLDDIDRQVF